MNEKLSSEIFNELSGDVKKYILNLESALFTTAKQNELLNENFKGLKNKREIIKQINYIYKTKEEKFNNLHFYEEGKIASLLWVLGLPENINDNEIEELVKNV